MKSKIEIELTEKEAGHLRTLLEGGIKISDSISQGEVFKNILDHLNSQDQEEVKNPEYDGIREVERQKFKNIVDTVNKRYPQDTPEEWEKEFELPDEIEHEDCIEVLADKHKLWEICSWEEPELDPDKVVAFIKQLLEERECKAKREAQIEVLTEIFQTCYQEDSKTLELVEEKLSKLTIK